MLHSCFLVMSIRAGAHWEISPQEAKKLSDAVARVARHYPVVSSQKGADWAQLMLVVGTIGVPVAKRVAYLEACRPEVAALNMGSMNYAKYSSKRRDFVFKFVFANPFEEIIELLEAMRRLA